jgi:hypothetical protein
MFIRDHGGRRRDHKVRHHDDFGFRDGAELTALDMGSLLSRIMGPVGRNPAMPQVLVNLTWM